MIVTVVNYRSSRPSAALSSRRNATLNTRRSANPLTRYVIFLVDNYYNIVILIIRRFVISLVIITRIKLVLF
jgi:hypothetical protein